MSGLRTPGRIGRFTESHSAAQSAVDMRSGSSFLNENRALSVFSRSTSNTSSATFVSYQPATSHALPSVNNHRCQHDHDHGGQQKPSD